MSKEKQNRPTNRFWFALGGFNAVAMLYPIRVYLGTTGGDEQLLASLLLVGIAFLLTITDAISVVFAYLL